MQRHDGAHPPHPKEEVEMKALFNRFVREESGQDLIEYGLLIGIITATVVTTVTLIGDKVKTYYTTLNDNLQAGGGGS
jgi:Flp pilus assembly pilin Flp